MTDPQLVFGFDPILGTSPSNARYTLRVFYDPTITFGTDGRPWALCLSDGAFTSLGQPYATLEDMYPSHTELRVFVQRLYQAGVAVVSMGYTIADLAIAGQGAIQPSTWNRIGTPPESFLTKDSASNATRSIERDVVNAIQSIRRNGLGVGLRTLNNEDGVIGAEAGSVGALWCSLARNRAETTATPGTFAATPTRVRWIAVVDPIATYNAYVDSVPVRHLPNDVGGVTANIGQARLATDAVQNFRDASALWHGFNFNSTKVLSAITPVYAVGRGPVTYTGSLAYGDFEDVLTDPFAPEQTLALEAALLGLDTEFGTTFHADNSRFQVNPRLSEEDLGQDMYEWWEAVTGFSGGGPVDPPPPTTVDPTLTIGFDPLLGDSTTNPRYQMNVFYREGIAFPGGNRPWMIVYAGGGWLPDSGLPFTSLNLTTSPTVWVDLYNLGWAIISPGYTVRDDTLPNFGCFRPDDAFRRIGTGDDSRLVIDQTKDAERCSEKDCVNVIQRIRLDGLGIGLDRTPGRGVIWGRSAGCSTGAWVAFGPDRSDPDADPTSRYAINTRVGAFLCRQPVFTLNQYADGVAIPHFINAAEDGPALTIGEARSDNPAQTFKDQAALWAGFNLESTRQLNSKMPVYMVGQETQTYFGPYTYDALEDLFPSSHPPEGILAMELELKAADTEFGTTTHTDVSQFVIEPVSEEEISEGMLEVALASGQAILEEPTSEKILREIEFTLRKVKAGIKYWTTLRNVRIADTAAVSEHHVPAALIRPYRTDMDGEGQTLTRAVRHSMLVQVMLIVNSRSTGGRDMELLVRDAITALYEDRTRGGNAVHTIVESVDRSYPEGDQQDAFVATLGVRVVFRTSHNDLATSL